ncbi:hypothetical protein G9A89_011098 [Geosiphon pyriformis]|nr:hypothetical protein G9A89_011098 [Geosiphon pyriformis]
MFFTSEPSTIFSLTRLTNFHHDSVHTTRIHTRLSSSKPEQKPRPGGSEEVENEGDCFSHDILLSVARAIKPSFYAVRTGREPGIYLTWDDCQQQVGKFKNASYKKFYTRKEAENFMFGADYCVSLPQSERKTVSPLKDSTLSSSVTTGEEISNDDSDKRSVKSKSEKADQIEKLTVYTDGCSRSNGQFGARAGVGVFWGDNDPRCVMYKILNQTPKYVFVLESFTSNSLTDLYYYVHHRNVSEPLPGSRQTNNRAEITAAIRALETCPNNYSSLEIKTDSQYLKKAIELWIPKWEKNGWKLARSAKSGKSEKSKTRKKNEESSESTRKDHIVENKDLFEQLMGLIRARTGKVKITYVEAHVGIHGNEEADRLANLGALGSPLNGNGVEPQSSTNDTVLLPTSYKDLLSSSGFSDILSMR